MRILLLSSNPQDNTFFGAVAKQTNLQLLQIPTVDHLCVEIQKDPSAILVLEATSEENYKNFETAIANKIGLFSDAIDVNRVYFVSDADLRQLSFLAKSDLFGHFISRSFLEDDKGRIAALFTAASEPPAFGIERFFPQDAKIQIITVTQSQQKKALVDSLKEYLSKVGFMSRMANLITTATDEIVMNAIFDAPIDETGKPIYAQTARTTAFELGDKQVVVKIAFDGKIVGISVSDQYGSIDKKKILDHISKSYEHDEFKVKINKAGAGLGLSNVFRNCGGLIFTCESGVKSEVTIFYRKTDSFKKFKDQFRFLSTFNYLS